MLIICDFDSLIVCQYSLSSTCDFSQKTIDIDKALAEISADHKFLFHFYCHFGLLTNANVLINGFINKYVESTISMGGTT